MDLKDFAVVLWAELVLVSLYKTKKAKTEYSEYYFKICQ